MAGFLGFLFALIVIASVVGAILLTVKRKKNNKKASPFNASNAKSKGGLGGTIACAASAAVFLVLFIFIPFGIKTVDAGEIAVVKVWGEAVEVRTAGIHFVNVISTKFQYYDARVQQIELNTEVYTKDAQPSDIEFVVLFRIDTSNAIKIATTFGEMEALQSRVEKLSLDKMKIVLGSKTAIELVETRSSLSPAVQESVQTIADQYYIIIESVAITDIAFSDAFEKAVEEKMIAEQEKLKAEYAKEQAETKAREQAEVARIKAEADLDVAVLNAKQALAEAKGQADAEMEIARGQANALKIKSVETARALGLPISSRNILDENNEIIGIEYEIDTTNATDAQYALLMEYMRFIEYLNTWDGKLPEIIGDGSSLGGIIVTP
ncbi:MAG: hypothetical protein LBS99_05555 [Clostridiales bacterium]|jgi:regulator of protease activity HflC (stomatin/prohibitin superfamily)|nr:hypothetical protein [Clostridiales bacterium]